MRQKPGPSRRKPGHIQAGSWPRGGVARNTEKPGEVRDTKARKVCLQEMVTCTKHCGESQKTEPVLFPGRTLHCDSPKPPLFTSPHAPQSYTKLSVCP